MLHALEVRSKQRAQLTPPTCGFTMLELLIAMAMVAILTAIALPSYLDSVRKGRRSDAVARLTQVQQAQERWRANNPAYTTDLGQLAVSATVPDGYYTLAIASASATGYQANATVLAGTPQADDSRCATLILDLQTGTISYWSRNSAGVLDNSIKNFCWNR